MICHFLAILFIYSLILFIVTDYLDGHLARKWHMVTDFGKFADPLADKLLTTVAFIYMLRDGVCSPVVLCIILAREFAVSGLRMVAAGAKDGKVIAANMWGKVKTVLQMLSIIFYFFGTALSYRGTVESVSIVVVVSIALCWLVAAVTAISGIKYLWDNRSFINTAKLKCGKQRPLHLTVQRPFSCRETIGNALRFALRIISGIIILYFAFVAVCGPLQTHFHERSLERTPSVKTYRF